MTGRGRFLAGLAALLILGGLYVQGLRYLHGHTLHPFDAEAFDDPAFMATPVPGPGADALTAYVHTGAETKSPVILFFMGNTGTLSVHGGFLVPHLAAGRTVIAMGYRGGGGLPGVPSEAALKADALALFDSVEALAGSGHGPVVVHGYSLGTALALHVAARRGVDGVILDAPAARFCDLFFRRYGLSACMIPFFETWDNLAEAAAVTAPVLIRHGDQDTAIPIWMGQQLADALQAQGTAVQFDSLPGITHDKITTVPDYGPGMARFIADLPPR